MGAAIDIDRHLLAESCRARHIRSLALFGSVLRPDFGPESDGDVLVEFVPGHTPGFGFFAIQDDELSAMIGRRVEIEDIEPIESERDKPRLATPDVSDILGLAGIEAIRDGGVRKAVLTAMRKTAENRVAGVTEQKRRRHCDHAASLVAACVVSDPSPETNRWAAALQERHRRFPALRAELDRDPGST